ncbi:MAG: hypothetical protein Q7R93_04840 [bacterium]|nr:hypothetical protein [bacterium]
MREIYGPAPADAEHNSFEEAQRKLEAALEQETGVRINPVDFRGVNGFADAEIIEDVRKIQEKEKMVIASDGALTGQAREIRGSAKLVESLLYASIRNSRIFGKDVNFMLASLYDDYFRGVDAFAEFTKDPKDPRHIGFSVDFTMSADTFASKMTKILESLQKGFVPSVKYFDSPALGKEKDVGMPRVIIAADYSAVRRVADAQIEQYAATGAIADVLGNDPIQYVILDEIRAQLRALRNVSYEMFQNEKAGAVYHRAYMTFMEAMKNRGIDEETLKVKSRGDSLHGRLVSLVGKYDRDAKK